MKKFIIIFAIIVAIIIIPQANAQIPGQNSEQKSVEIKVGLMGEMKVKHVIKEMLDLPYQLDLLNGTKSNLTVKNQEGIDVQYGTIGEGNSIMILPSRDETIVEYTVEDELILKDNLWTLDFFYLQSTSVIFPEEVDLVYVNNQPAFLGEKNGILCHGCKMILEYSFNEPKIFENIQIQENEFLIEIRTWGNVDQFSFEPSKGIGFEVIEDNKFVTVTIPVDFLSKPYQVFLDEEKIRYHQFPINETHYGINVRPQNSGEISITGTLVPEIKLSLEESFGPVIIIIGVIIIGVAASIFFLKRKK